MPIAPKVGRAKQNQPPNQQNPPNPTDPQGKPHLYKLLFRDLLTSFALVAETCCTTAILLARHINTYCACFSEQIIPQGLLACPQGLCWLTAPKGGGI